MVTPRRPEEKPLTAGLPAVADVPPTTGPNKRGFNAGLVAAALLVALGIAARLWHVAINYSLNHDDAALAVNIVARDVGELRGPLMFDQVAPWGFVAVERAVVTILGPSEQALRLFPLACSVVALLLFAKLSRAWLRPLTHVWATGFFAVSQAIVAASAAVKQYSTEVLACVAILAIAEQLIDRVASRRRQWLCGLVGAGFVWFSLSAIFILAALVVAGLADFRGLWRQQFLLPTALWALSVVGYATVVMAGQMQGTPMFEIWRAEFLPADPREWLGWCWRAVNNLASVSTSVRLAPLMAVAVLAAVAHTILRGTRRTRVLAFIVAAPFAAACAHVYPFVGRFLFFAVPATLLCEQPGR